MQHMPPLPDTPRQMPPLPDIPEQVAAGGKPALQNNPAISNKINLDDSHGELDPSTALLGIVAERAGCTVEQLKDKGFTFTKGFRGPDDKKDEAIPIFAYKNAAGKDNYYFVRHWQVKVDGNPPLVMDFSKKIYTNVEVPKGTDASEHKQKQYIAALAARTYANIEESRMLKTGGGVENDLYKSVAANISKIAKDRFVTLEMFNNSKKVTINSHEFKKLDSAVDTIRLQFKDVKPAEGDKGIQLGEKASKIQEKHYRFKADENSSLETRGRVAAFNVDDVIKLIDSGMKPEEAAKQAGLKLEELQAQKRKELDEAANSFRDNLAHFSSKDSLIKLMAKQDVILSEGTAKKLTDLRVMQRIMPDPLIALKKLNSATLTGTKPEEKDEARKILEATKTIYEEMRIDHADIAKHEQALKKLGLPTHLVTKEEREKQLQEMNRIIDRLDNILNPVVEEI